MAPHFELYQGRDGEYRWRLRAANGEVIADGAEGYKDKADCRTGIDLVKAHAAAAVVEGHSAR